MVFLLISLIGGWGRFQTLISFTSNKNINYSNGLS
jgi:hypothetical protein